MADIAAFQEVLLPLAALQTRHDRFSLLGRHSSSGRPIGWGVTDPSCTSTPLAPGLQEVLAVQGPNRVQHMPPAPMGAGTGRLRCPIEPAASMRSGRAVRLVRSGQALQTMKKAPQSGAISSCVRTIEALALSLRSRHRQQSSPGGRQSRCCRGTRRRQRHRSRLARSRWRTQPNLPW